MKKVLRRLIIVAFLAFAAFSLFSCEADIIDDNPETKDYSQEVVDTWIRLGKSGTPTNVKMLLQANGNYRLVKTSGQDIVSVLELGTYFTSGNIIFFEFVYTDGSSDGRNSFLVVNDTYLTINTDENYIRELKIDFHNN